MLEKNFPLEVNIDRHESTSFNDGSDGFVIYLKVQNKSSETQKINVLKANYITIVGEQIVQDSWLNGYLKDEDLLMPNAFKQAGLIFYKPKLKQIEQNDVIYITIELPKKSKEQSFCFQYKEGKWLLTNSTINNIELELTPKQINDIHAKSLLNKIERLEAFEERFGISIQNFSIENFSLFNIYCEVHPTIGTSIKEDIELQCVVYDLDGLILKKTYYRLKMNDFFGFEVVNFTFYSDFIEMIPQISKIRIYPKK
jgi:hypothetical protein